jgi:hypothetical protein
VLRLSRPELNICLALFLRSQAIGLVHPDAQGFPSGGDLAHLRRFQNSEFVFCAGQRTKKRNMKAEKTAFPITCRLDWAVDRDCAGELLKRCCRCMS